MKQQQMFSAVAFVLFVVAVVIVPCFGLLWIGVDWCGLVWLLRVAVAVAVSVEAARGFECNCGCV